MNGDDDGDSPSQRYQQRRLERAQATLAEWPDASSAIAVLSDWVLTHGLAPEGGLGWSAFRRLPHDAQPAAALARAGYGAAANAVDSAIEDHLDENPAGRLLFGLALGKTALAVSNPASLENLVTFAAEDPVTASAFGECFREEAAARPEVVATLAAAAHGVVDRFNENPGRFVMGRHAEEFSERVRTEGKGTRVEDLWSDRLWGEMFLFGRGYLLDLLRTLNTQAYLDLLEQFRHPAPVRACLALIRRPETLLNLLPHAPVAFAGLDWTGAMVRPLLVLAYFALFVETRREGGVGGTGPDREGPTAPTHVAEALLRPDTAETALAFRFQAYLVKQFGLRFRESGGREPEPRDGPRFAEWTFIAALASALPASGEEVELLPDVPESDRLYTLVAVALSRDAHDGATEDLADALERTAGSLDAVTAFSSGELLPEHWHMTQLAGVLARASDPLERWSRLWRLTASLRDRAAHRRAHTAHELIYVAPFLLCLGLRACDHLHESPAVARRLWGEVQRATLETYLVERLLRGRLDDIVVRVVARALLIPEEQSNEAGAASSQLFAAIAAYLAPDALAAHIFLTLELNGVEPSTLARATAEAGRDLVALCAEIETLAELGALRTLSADNRAALRRLAEKAGQA